MGFNMKSLFRVSIDESDTYVVDYIVRTGYYAGRKSSRSFKSFTDMTFFVLQYLTNFLIKNE